MGEMRNAYKMLVGKPEGKRPPREDQGVEWRMILLAIMKVGWKVVDWIHVAQDRGHCQALISSAINVEVL
jgi:hypothetical protein